MVDQYVDYSQGSAQYNWLQNDLDSSTKDWKIILLHEPGWTAGNHSNNTDVQNYIQPLCIQYGVRLVICGHNHYYARAEVNGVVHITSGGGGAPQYTPGINHPNIIVAERALHHCTIEIQGSSLTFKAIKPDGNVVDSFTITGHDRSIQYSTIVESQLL